MVVALAVVESICFTIAAKVPGEQRIWGMLSCLLALVAVSVLLVVLAKIEKTQAVLSDSSPDIMVVRINSRADLYRKAADLLNDAKKYVQDTTWSRDVTNTSRIQEESKKTYLEAQRAVISRGVDYRELFGVTEGRKKRLADAHQLDQQHKNYQVQEINLSNENVSMLDFMVIDGVHVLLSHVDAAEQKSEQNYIYIKNDLLAVMFKEVFDECWTRAKSESKSKSKIVIAE